MITLRFGRFGVAVVFQFVAVLAMVRAVPARDIGPDAFGYRASDVPYVFEDLAGSGRRLLAHSSDDVVTLPIGFPFEFYGETYDSVSWSSNGLITFGGTNAEPLNVSFAAAAPAGDLPSIAVLWDDWQFVQPGADATYFEVRGVEGSRRLMLQWNLAFASPSSPSNVVFEATLFEGSNNIRLAFPDVDTATASSFGASATVGIRAAGGHLSGEALEWSFNTATIMTRQCILFVAPTDTTPPSVTITAPADGAIIGAGAVDVTVSVSDESRVSVASSPAGVAASFPTGGGTAQGSVPLVEGSNSIVVSAVDDFGNVGGASITVVRDTTPPEITIVSPADGAILADTPASVAVQVVDANATTVDVGPSRLLLPAGGGTVVAQVDLDEGWNSVAVSVVDAVGNTTSATLALMLDSNTPLVTVDAPADGSFFGAGESPVVVVVTVDDATTTQVHSVPAGVSAELPAGGGVAVGALPLVEGPNSVTVTAVDATGHTGAASITLHLDTMPPAVAISSPSVGMMLRGEVDFSAQAADAGSGVARVELRVDGAPVASFTNAPFDTILDTSEFADGPHMLTAAATDRTGNSAVASVRVVFDNTAPVVSFTAPAADASVSGTVAFTVEASDGGSGLVLVQVLAADSPPSVDPTRSFDPAAPSARLEGEDDTTQRDDGLLAFTALAVDAAGNEATAHVSVQVDNTPPSDVSVLPVSGSVVSGVIEVMAECASMSDATLELYVDDELKSTSTTSPLAFELDTTTRPDGMLSLRAVARDHAGNESSAASRIMVKNLAVQMSLMPTMLCIQPKSCGPKSGHGDGRLVIAHLQGDGLDRLVPVKKHVLELRVAGGSPVPALGSVREHTKGMNRKQGWLHVKFSRDALISAIRAGIAAGSLDPHDEVAVSLYADGALVATAFVRVAER